MLTGSWCESVQDKQYEEAVESGMWTELCRQLDVESSTSFEDYVLCDTMHVWLGGPLFFSEAEGLQRNTTSTLMHRAAEAVEPPPTTRHQTQGRGECGLQKEYQLEAIHILGKDLYTLRTFDFAAVLVAPGGLSVDTKLGPVPAGSSLSYQQANFPAGLDYVTRAATVTPVPPVPP
ncbi:hypothetical protein HPB48_024632 [Haemaphysalis longicornis]|uniref:Uncharacterized protein n=1 Tax=Haemaphysalis longicornis TaxID=44386 RepID=A0A9J6H6L9_HAELO|nr:hypothetical protein HPB48_024632 [Haemaphysalis longicornis]